MIDDTKKDHSGLVGAITVSDMPSQDDHKLVVEVIRNYLASER